MQQPCGLLLAAGLDGGNTLHCTSGTMATSPFGVAKKEKAIHQDGFSFFHSDKDSKISIRQSTFYKGNYPLPLDRFPGKKLLCIIPCIRIPCIYYMKWMRFCDSRNSKDTNVIPICYNGLVHKTDSNISCNQCLDGNKTAD